MNNLGQDTALLVVVMLARLLLVAAFSTVYIYTPELFPTEVRNTVLGAASSMGRVSGMTAAFVGGPLVSILEIFLSAWLNTFEL